MTARSKLISNKLNTYIMNEKKERTAALWADTLNAAKQGDVQRRAVDVLVDQYNATNGIYYQYGRKAWEQLCDIVGQVLGEGGKDIAKRAIGRLHTIYKDPSVLNRARAEHNHWRRLYIKKQLAELRAERSELMLESETIVEPNK